MGWNNLDDRLAKKSDSVFVSCEEQYELDRIKKAIKEEFPYFSDDRIDKAMKKCCVEVDVPRLRIEYLECLKYELGGKW